MKASKNNYCGSSSLLQSSADVESFDESRERIRVSMVVTCDLQSVTPKYQQSNSVKIVPKVGHDPRSFKK